LVDASGPAIIDGVGGAVEAAGAAFDLSLPAGVFDGLRGTEPALDVATVAGDADGSSNGSDVTTIGAGAESTESLGEIATVFGISGFGSGISCTEGSAEWVAELAPAKS
jgi:hypothetical protein